MDKKSIWKWLTLVMLTAASLALVYPPKEKVKLGLDLKGGTSFVVEIDNEDIARRLQESDPSLEGERLQAEVAKAAKLAGENALEVIRNRVDGLGIAEPIIYAASYEDRERIVVQLPGVGEAKRREAADAIQSVAFLEFRLVEKNSAEWTRALFDQGKAPEGFKIGEKGDYYVRDTAAVKDEEMDREFHARLRRFEARPGSEFMLERDSDASGRTIYRPHYVQIRRQLTGDALKTASVQYHPQTSVPYITLEFSRQGGRQFATVTRNYAPRGEMNRNSDEGRQLAIILDGTLYSAPSIREEIAHGQAQITGHFSVPEAMRLANVLRSGSLPAPVEIVETRSVDPSLGRDSIFSGQRAAMFGAAGVVAFMLIYYMKAGLVANIALALNLVLLPLGMVVVSGFLGLIDSASRIGGTAISLPTLTMPGIAGLVLTLGMAVDANVLIFERIREELASGKRLGSAVSAGYEKAFSTILDANVTTLLTAVILFWQGSGPVRGFAITLSAGIVVSMFTALVVTRLIFDIMTRRNEAGTIRMLSLINNPQINFIKVRKLTAAISIVAIAVTGALFAMRGNANLGVDFTGGESLTMTFAQANKPGVDEVRKALEDAGIKQPSIQYQREMAASSSGTVKEYLELTVGAGEGDKAKEVMASFEDAEFRTVKEDSVGPQMGREIQRKGILALGVALLGIVIYISLRFEFAFAIGAIVALAHDVLLTVGIYTLLGRQLSLPIIAALLTIVGYSVNDTIVIFDRIREDLKLMRGKPYSAIANLSINQTLSRTLLTSLTTLIAVVLLLVFGGGAINDFALTLLIGVVVGTYSSIYIATPIMLLWHKDKKPVEVAKAV